MRGQEVFGSGVASGTTVSSGGRLLVLSGGVASSSTVMSGGIFTVSAGGSAVVADTSAGYACWSQAPTSLERSAFQAALRRTSCFKTAAR
jgi:autotransporter passenger strand-loop-strand repeat protein